MKAITIKLKDILQVMSAIGNNSYLLLAPVIDPIKSQVAAGLSLESDMVIDVTLDQLEWIYEALKSQKENEYSGCNGRLLQTLINMASGDMEIAQWLQEKNVQRDARVTSIIVSGCRYLGIDPDSLYPKTSDPA